MQAEPLHNEQYFVSLFQEGDEKGLAFFFREFFPALVLYANNLVKDRLVAEELASDSFEKTWKMHHKLDSYAGIRAYLYKTLQRDCYRAIKKEKKRKNNLQLTAAPFIDEAPSYHQIIKAETFRLLHSAIQKLSPGNKKVIEMHYLQEKNVAEIANELNISTSTIHTQKTRALQALQKMLAKSLLLILLLF